MPDHSSDPLGEVVALLKPAPSISKLVEAGGRWMVERRDMRSPFYCAVVEGNCLLTIEGRAPMRLTAGDFVLLPEVDAFTMSSTSPSPPGAPRRPLETGPGTFRLGGKDEPVEMRALVGHCRFEAPDRELLVSLLPEVIHVSGQDRLTGLVRMIHEETRAERLARSMVLERLLEVLLIEALRTAPQVASPPGLLRGLADPHLATALRQIHAGAAGLLSVTELARIAAMSRSAFFDRFRRELGAAPMEYVTAWRMALAKEMLLRGGLTNVEIALRIGYGSASAFGMAFSRHVGISPGTFAEKQRGGQPAPQLPERRARAI